jgi:7-carboxy-7-deazaguanine synthase
MKTYSVREIFLTVQGEGSRAGSKSVFLRFAGCNLWDGLGEHRHLGKGACARWCDTDFAKGEPMTAPAILASLEKLWPDRSAVRWVVVTGGEPGLQLDVFLVGALQQDGWRVSVETNGTIDSAAILKADLITLSPKKGGALALTRCDELKVVLPGHIDAAQGWTQAELRGLLERYHPAHAFVQPMDPVVAGDGSGNARCLTVAMADPTWRISLQTHKYLQVP